MSRILIIGLLATSPAFVPVQPAPKPNPPKYVTNSIGMKFVWIPPGSFTMGSPKDEPARREDETQHEVTLSKGFYMGIYTVTQEQWQLIMGENPSAFRYGAKNLPVESVSWNDCQKFIAKLKEKDKKPYRLPTEAEWEYACRAGTTTPFYCGKRISVKDANFNSDLEADVYADKERSQPYPLPVGVYPPNPWGLYDMHGNVEQWCQDLADKYSEKAQVDPQGPEKAQVKGHYRIARGSSFRFPAAHCRSTVRASISPDARISTVGLRICFTPLTDKKQ